MSSITEQLSATSKTQFEHQLNFLNDVLKKAVDGAQQVAALNLHTAKSAAEKSAAAARQLIEARDARAVLELARPTAAIEGLLAYGRELFTIASDTQAELLRSAGEQFRGTEQTGKTLVLAAPAVAREAVQPVADVVAKAAESTEQVAQTATTNGVEAASDTIAAAAAEAQPAADAVTDAVEQVAEAVAQSAPAAATAALFDGDTTATPKTARNKPAAKPVAEAVAALADKPATTLKSVPGNKPRK